MIRKASLAILTVSATIALAAPAGAVVTFESTTVRMFSSTEIRIAGRRERRTRSPTQTRTTIPSSLTVRSVAQSRLRGSTARAVGIAEASFVSPEEFGFEATSDTLLRIARTNRLRSVAESGRYRFDYVFDTTTAATIDLSYDLFDPDRESNASRVRYTLSGPTLFSDLLVPNMSGMLTTLIQPGRYELSIVSAGYLNEIEADGRRRRVLRGESADSYSFLITPQLAVVPEPATWTTMILGFGLMGAVARRRRDRNGIATGVASLAA